MKPTSAEIIYGLEVLSKLSTEEIVAFPDHHYPILCNLFNKFEKERWEAAYKILLMHYITEDEHSFNSVYNYIYRNIVDNTTEWCVWYKAHTKQLFPRETQITIDSWCKHKQ